MNCPNCHMYKQENERLWRELDVLLKMIEKHTQTEQYGYIKADGGWRWGNKRGST